MNPGPNPLEAFGAAVPALSRAMAVRSALTSPAFTASAVQLRSTYAPLAFSLGRVASSLDRVESKRRRAICKLGRQAANRSSVLAAVEELSLQALEQLLDAFLRGEALPEELGSRLELRAVRRSDVESEAERQRRARLEHRYPPSRKPRRARSERRPQASRLRSRPVGSLAPPLGAHPTPDRCNPPRGAPVT